MDYIDMEHQKDNSDYLYHYTSLSTLALILRNRNIRFNSLLNVDDLQEKESNGNPNIGQYCYVSCWTNDEKESIPMWRMYGNWQEGVRIGLRKNLFKIIENQKVGDEVIRKSYFLFEDMNKRNYCVFCCDGAPSLLRKVEYTDEFAKLKPNSTNFANGSLDVNFIEIGIYKNSYWEFQNEYRYLFYAIPINIKATSMDIEQYINNFTGKLICQPFEDYYLDIADDAFQTMEIMFSPNMSLGNRILGELLIEKYNPNAKLVVSKLEGIIK